MKNKTICSWKNQFRFFVASPAIVWQVLFLCLPLAIICGLSVVTLSEADITVSLARYAQFFNPLYLAIIKRSFSLAFVNTLLCFICAYPLAYYLAFFVNRFKNLMLFFLLLPFWTSLLVLAYAWFFILENHGIVNTILLNFGIVDKPIVLLNTPFAVYLVMLYCYLPFMTLPIYSVLEKLDRKLLEASADLGATSIQTFLRITFPLSLSGVKTGIFLVFIPSFGEFVIPALLGGNKEFFIGSLITHYFLVSRNQYVGAAFTCFSGLFLAGVSYVLYRFFAYYAYQGGIAPEESYRYEKE